MTSLKARLKTMIQASGPISVATYMDLCLHDRQHGYYATRPGLGEDFITAPEISQVFGELIGLWAVDQWQQMGRPERVSWVEVGPGRGTLMADALRAARAVEGALEAIDLHFIEASPILQAALADRFAAHSMNFCSGLEHVPTHQPFILIANEWLDCLPVQQYVRVGEAWHERIVGLDDNGDLAFGLNVSPLPDEMFPAPEATALEIQPGLKTLCTHLETLFAAAQGRALLIDYGSRDTPQDTLRAFQTGSQIDPLACPGQSDLTCDVDFGRLVRLIEAAKLPAHTLTSQSAFLLSLGAEARLNQLAKTNPAQADEIYQSVRRLVDPAELGTRFLVLTLGEKPIDTN